MPSVDIVCLDQTILNALENSRVAESTVSKTLILILRELGITKGQVTINNYHTYNGKLGYYVECSQDGKTLTINQDGTWKCTLNDYNTTNFSINREKNGISLNVNAKTTQELDDYINDLASYDITTTKKELENAKKLVRKITQMPE